MEEGDDVVRDGEGEVMWRERWGRAGAVESAGRGAVARDRVDDVVAGGGGG